MKRLRRRTNIARADRMCVGKTAMRNAILEALEPRLLMSLSPVPATVTAVQGSVSSVGNLDGAGAVYVANNTVTVDRVRELSLTLGDSGTIKIKQSAHNDEQAHVSVVSALNFLTDPSTSQRIGRLDLTNNALVIKANGLGRSYMEANVLPAIVAALNEGYSNGNWSGHGIISSVANGNLSLLGGLGYSFNQNPSNNNDPFFSVDSDPDSIVVRYTVMGDCTLDGQVTIADFLTLQNNFNKSGKSWTDGDFNYDGQVTIADFLTLQNNFNKGISLTSPDESGTPTPPAFVGGFTDTGTHLPSDFQVTVNWHDGSTSAGAIVGEDGTFNVFADHTYTHAAIYPVDVVVKDNSGTLLLTVRSTAIVEDADGGHYHVGTGELFNVHALDADSVVIGSGTTEYADRVRAENMTVSGTLVLNPGMAAWDQAHRSVLSGLQISKTGNLFDGTIDITNNALIIHTTTATRESVYQEVLAAVRSGYNGGDWQGTGITSSLAAADPSAYAVAVVKNDYNIIGNLRYYSFDPDYNSVIVAFAKLGDLNLDGRFESTQDPFTIGTGDWAKGDMDYDGQVTISDFLFAQNGHGTFVRSLLPETAASSRSFFIGSFVDDDPLADASGYSVSIDWDDGSSPGFVVPDASISGMFHVFASHTFTTSDTYDVAADVSNSATGLELTLHRLITASNAPSAPSGLTSTVVNNGITLNWTAVTGAVRYDLYRTVDSAVTLIGSVTDTTYFEVAAFNAAYTYAVVAVDADGIQSSAASTSPVTASSSPTNVDSAPLTGTGSTQSNGVLIRWDGTTTGVSYELYRQTGSGDPELIHTFASSISSYSDFGTNGLSAGTYTYYLVALNSFGVRSSPSLSTSVTLQNGARPAAPNTLTGNLQGIIVNGLFVQQLHLGWQTSTPELSFHIQVSNNGASGWGDINLADGTIDTDGKGITFKRSFHVGSTELAVTSKRYYRVYLSDQSSNSDYSNIVSPIYDAEDSVVLLTASVQSSPGNSPSIILHWPASASATGYKIFRRLKGSNTWGNARTMVAGNALGWTDTNVTPGASYDYRVDRLGTYAGTGYILSGIDVPAPSTRGMVLLVVDGSLANISATNRLTGNFTGALAAELQRLRWDLIGEGWSVLTRVVARDDDSTDDRLAEVEDVKNKIRDDYRLYPAISTVFIIGHVPVPYSGDASPDGHTNIHGAWPADIYYGDMTASYDNGNGLWTDNIIDRTLANPNDPNDTTLLPAQTRNVHGDGKFDQNQVPGDHIIELAVGRVDLARMQDFPAPNGNITLREIQLLQRYFDKDHAFRQGLFTAQDRAVILDNRDPQSSLARPTYRSLVPLVGLDNITAIRGSTDNIGLDRPWFDALDQQPVLWGAAHGGGYWNWIDGVAWSDYFNRFPSNAVFNIVHSSYTGDWDHNETLVEGFGNTSFMKSIIAGIGASLTVSWNATPSMYYQMGLGGTVGASMQVTQNNQPNVWAALMGDPTLTLKVIKPATAVQLSDLDENGGRTISWTRSVDDPNNYSGDFKGYNIYRSTNRNGNYVQLNTNGLIAGHDFYDAEAEGNFYYLIQGVNRVTTPSGTYFQTSGGAYGNFVNSATASSYSTDTSTGGDWRGTYGSSGYAVAGSAYWNLGRGALVNPTIPQVIDDFNHPELMYTTSDIHGQFDPSIDARRGVTWNQNDDLLIDLNAPNTFAQKVTLYFYDFAHATGEQQVDILDGQTGALLDSQTADHLSTGQYMSWDVHGHVIIRIHRTGNTEGNVLLNGIFFDPLV